MDREIQSLIDILKITDQEIAKLLVSSKHYLRTSSTYGSRWHSMLSTFSIISPPSQTAQLHSLSDKQKQKIFNAVLLLFPLADKAPEITEILYVADASLSSMSEFVQIINEDDLINDISIALNLLERKPPKFWINYLQGHNSLLEDDYRSEFFRMLGMKYQIGSEEESKQGRTDLAIKSNSLCRMIFEFKIWSRNDPKNTVPQLLGYLTEIEDTGFIIMGNVFKNKNIQLIDYEEVVKSPEYIEGSMKYNKTNHGYEFIEAEYDYKSNRKKIYHFILNLK